MTLTQLLNELQDDLFKLQRQAITNPSDVTRGKIAAMQMIIERIKYKRRAQVSVKLKLPFEVE